MANALDTLSQWNMLSPEEKIKWRLDSIKRMKVIYALKLSGKAYHQIAEELGVSEAICVNEFRRLARVVAKQQADETKELRALEVDRLERLIEVLMPAAEAGDLKAIDRIVTLITRKAKFLGLDAALKIDVNSKVSIDREPRNYSAEVFARRLEEMRERLIKVQQLNPMQSYQLEKRAAEARMLAQETKVIEAEYKVQEDGDGK